MNGLECVHKAILQPVQEQTNYCFRILAPFKKRVYLGTVLIEFPRINGHELEIRLIAHSITKLAVQMYACTRCACSISTHQNSYHVACTRLFYSRSRTSVETVTLMALGQMCALPDAPRTSEDDPVHDVFHLLCIVVDQRNHNR